MYYFAQRSDYVKCRLLQLDKYYSSCLLKATQLSS